MTNDCTECGEAYCGGYSECPKCNDDPGRESGAVVWNGDSGLLEAREGGEVKGPTPSWGIPPEHQVDDLDPSITAKGVGATNTDMAEFAKRVNEARESMRAELSTGALTELAKAVEDIEPSPLPSPAHSETLIVRGAGESEEIFRIDGDAVADGDFEDVEVTEIHGVPVVASGSLSDRKEVLDEGASRLENMYNRGPPVATAEITVDGETFHVEVDEVSIERDYTCDRSIVELHGEVVTEADADELQDASSATGPDTDADGNGAPLAAGAHAPQAGASADESDGEGDGPSPPDDGLCEACEDVEWAIRMFDSELEMYFHYCESCSLHKEMQFDSLTRDGVR